MVNTVLLSLWWFGTGVWLFYGISALIAPARWSRSGAIWKPRNLSKPYKVRLIGVVMTAVGIYWAIKGVQLLTGEGIR
jgi:hypothetical protein